MSHDTPDLPEDVESTLDVVKTAHCCCSLRSRDRTVFQADASPWKPRQGEASASPTESGQHGQSSGPVNDGSTSAGKHAGLPSSGIRAVFERTMGSFRRGSCGEHI